MDRKESFLQYIQSEKRYSQHTVRSYRDDLEQYFLWLGSQDISFNATEATSVEIRGWIVALVEGGYSPVSVHRKASTLRAYYKYLLRQGVIRVSPIV